MAKQLNVNLSFTADASKAKAQLQDLQNSLSQLTANAGKVNSGGFGLTKDLTAATSKVVELQAMLEGCKTTAGTLDLGKLNQSMKSNNSTIKDYAQALSSLGPQGDQAFAQLARSITQAEVPMKRVNGLVAEFATTLKNTARWQLSSSILHGFMGSVQKAYGYAQDLNESLNEIRIVTGQSVDQMDKFAARANKAAKALSTTTTAYTDAALIFYQQGLSDEQVEERTNVTIKMAQVAGENATDVSSYMTAIWNNFDDGSKSLEYYGDVMTELGAKTAASSAEIAEGLEKFAAIGETVGLSYEYATAAVATVVDKTRESADTVGTAFKTIFARLQGLQLGETLEDGVNLNKYSAALQKVGIDIIDLNGNLKDADVIINELGETWNTLTRAQQTALAQTVAGTRQYTQLMALMNNFNAFQSNVSSAKNAEGTLTEQQDIYAESWEAASKRVQAAAEEIYNQLLNDDFFIAITNGFSNFLSVLSDTIDGLGGLPGVLSVASTIMFKMFGPDMVKSIEDWSFNLKLKTKEGVDEILNQRKKANSELRKLYADSSDSGIANATRADVYQSQADLQDVLIIKQQELVQKGTQLSEEEQKQANLLLDINQAMGEQAIAAAQNLETQEKIALALESQARIQIKAANKESEDPYENFGVDIDVAKEAQIEYGKLQSIVFKMSKETDFSAGINSLKAMVKTGDKYGTTFESIQKILKRVGKEINNLDDLQIELQREMEDVGVEAQNAFDKIIDGAEQAGVDTEEFKKVIKEMQASYELTGRLTTEQIQKLKDYGLSIDEASGKISKMKGPPASIAQGIVALGQSLSAVATVASTVKGLFDVWNDEDASFGERMLATFTTLATVIPLVTTAMGESTRTKVLDTAAEIANWIAKKQGIQANVQDAATEKAATAAETGHTAATIAQTVAQWAQNAALGPFLLIVLAVVAALALLVVGVMAIVAAYKAWQAASPEGQLKAAKEEASRLGEELEKATDASESLKESINGYDNAVAKMKTLTEGTAEWREALEEANEAAQKLIDENDSLKGQYNYNAETGLIEFDDGALENLQKEKNDKVRTVRAQSLMANNAVMTAQNNVDRNDLVKADDVHGAVFGALASSPATWGIGAALATKQVVENKGQNEALDALAQAFIDSGGNMAKAMNSLEPATHAMILSLDATQAELDEFCRAVKDNADAMHENNKQIIDTYMADNQAYQDSSNKDFLNEVMANDLAEQAEELYNSQYKDKNKLGFGTGISDAEAQKQYAELMGWDADLVKDDWGNKAVYINEEGEEVTVSDEQVRRYLAQEAALKGLSETVDDTSANISRLTLFEKKLANANDGSIESYEEYKEAMMDYGAELGLTNKEVEKYINSQGSLQDSAKKATLSQNIQSWGYDSKMSNQAAEEFTKNLTSEQMQLAVEVSASTDSWDEFNREFSSRLRESLLSTTQSAASEAKTILDSAAESGEFTAGDTQTLLSNETFTKYLKEQGKTELEFTHANYSEKMAIVSQYYADLRLLENKQLEEAKQNYEEDLAEYQAILDYKRAMESGDKTTAGAIANEFSNIDFTAYMDMDISEVESKMDQIQARIDEIDGQRIELNMSWDGVDTVENSVKKIGNFAKTMEKDAKKIGGSYQLTAAQAREWMEVYPDLFKQATVTTDGLIKLDDAYVQEFMANQEKATDEAIEADIKQMQSEIDRLTLEKQAYAIDLELATTMADGKMKLEGASAEYLAETREKLTQYYIDNGLDQVAADKAALDSMGLNQQEYSKLVAGASSRNAENMVKSTEQGATGMVSIFSKMWDKLKNFWGNMGKAAGNIIKVFRGEATWDDVYDNVIDAYGLAPEEQIDSLIAYDKNGNFKDNFEYKRTATLKEVGKQQVEDIKAAMATIDSQIGTLQSKITYLRALQKQDLDEYGSTSPDEVDGSDKTIEELTKIAERYHEITRLIAQQETALERLRKAKDRTYGKDQLALIDEEIKALKILEEKESELMALQTVFLGLDKKKVQDTFTNAEFDEYGNISNYTKLLENETTVLNAAKAQYNKTNSDADKKLLEDAQKKYDERLQILEQYEETLDAWREQEDKLTDIHNQIQDANFEKITRKVELNVEINERELAEIDYYLEKIADDFYSMEEAAVLMKDKLHNYTSEINASEKAYEQLKASYAAGDISKGQFIEGLTNTYDSILDNLSALTGLDNEMLHYYENTLSAANDEMDIYSTRMEHLTGVLDHYRSIVELVNGEYDYEAIGAILEGQAKTRENELATVKAEYEMLLAEKESIEAQMASVEEGSEAWDLYNEELQAITEATIEAEEEMLSKTEEWAETMKSIMENTFASAAYEMEMMMTQGLGFDALSNSLDKLSTFQEEYLTNTNEIFELEKMMRTAQQAADKTNNEAAKIKLKNYQNEIETLKNDGLPLSQLELNIQKAKYELLLAEIALEEAQNAKSTVRLQRDSEGNFGYVYTADTEAISSAEQDLADAQNNLYNIGLEGTNDYGQKLLELQNQLSDDLIALEEERAAGRFKTDEEYYAAKNDLITHYNNLFTAYSNQYTTALGVDNRIQEDAWINAYQNMIIKTENWKDYTKEYTQECEDAYDEWRENAVDNNELIQGVLDDTEDEVKEVTKASDKLKKKVVDDVIPAVQSELIAVRNVTSQYAKQREEIRKNIVKYQELIKEIRKVISLQNGMGGAAGYDNEGNITDYSWAMADYLANQGGSIEDEYWKQLVKGRDDKLATKEYSKYAEGADEFEEMMEKYYEYKTQGIDNELTKYVEDVIANKQYWDQNKVENLIDEFATGGYTGAWGPEGRLAVVHEKELMLNQEDTVNFLQGIGLLREIAQMIDLEAMRNQLGALPYLPIANMQGAGGLLEQSVHIEANFPGVSDRYEIEEAFNNILNTATQYANRKI